MITDEVSSLSTAFVHIIIDILGSDSLGVKRGENLSVGDNIEICTPKSI